MLLGAVGAAVGFAPTCAVAKQARVFTGTFGAAGSSVSDLYPLAAGHEGETFWGPWSVAVDTSHGPSQGDVYVTDAHNNRVEKFDSSGKFILMFGKEVDKTKVEAHAPEPEQNVCTAVSGDKCQEGTAGSTPGALESSGPLFVAVDSSGGPSQGDVYVANYKEHAALANRVTKFDSAGNLISSWGTGGQLDGSGVTSPPAMVPGPFTIIDGVAVDPAGNLWVDAQQAAFEFKQDGSFITDWAHGETRPLGIAVGGGGAEDSLYLAEGGVLETVVKYSAAGVRIGAVTEPGTSNNSPFALASDGFAVDPLTNDVIDLGSRLSEGVETLNRFEASCQMGALEGGCVAAEIFRSGRLPFGHGVAVDSSGPGDTVYAADFDHGEVDGFSVVTVPDVVTAPASGFASGAAVLNGTVNPDGVPLKEGREGCRFEWGETEAYGNSAPCDETAAQIGTGTKPVEVNANVSGLQSGKGYHFRLVAGNANDVNGLVDEPSLGQDVSFGPPRIDGEFTTEVRAKSATFGVEVDPTNIDTHYKIEYGTSTGYGKTTPEPDLGSGGIDQHGSLPVSELEPNTLYHYRVLAENVLGTVEGEDHTFTTQHEGAFALPDAREWEMVSPPEKHGAQIYPILLEEGVIQASTAGSAVTYSTSAPTETEPEGYAKSVQVLAARGSTGWVSRDIAIPHEQATGLAVGRGQEYRFFSEDLSHAVVQPFGPFNPTLSEEASEQTAYMRTDYLNGNLSEPCLPATMHCYHPLVTPENATSGHAFGHGGGSEVVGTTPDLSHIVLNSKVGLTSTLGDTGGLYEWSAGTLQLISILPGGSPFKTTEGSEPALGFEDTVARHAMSADGSRVVWSARDSKGSLHLYLTDTTKGETVQLDSGLPGSAEYQTASANGSTIFFIDAGDLYAYNVDVGKLDALTVGASVQRQVLGASEDGLYVYFIADAALTEHAVHGTCAGVNPSASEMCDLYMLHNSGAKWEPPRLVAVLSGADSHDWARGSHELPSLTARVSPDGRWLAYMSRRSLTGYDNRDAVSGQPDEEVYLYHADGETMVCASCDPTGARPVGAEYKSLSNGLVGGREAWPNTTWLAANVPGWTPYEAGLAAYQSRYLSDSGRLFFNSATALVPQDVNGTWDVYEYEPPGVGSCTPASATFGERSGGCVDLISSGRSPQESGFLDASESGGDVFFLTSARLDPHRDFDSAVDLYDAHECTGSSPCLPAFVEPFSPCSTQPSETSCRPAPSPQPGIFGAPSSATFFGAGNLTPSLLSGPPVASTPLTRAQKLARALAACRRKPRKTRSACQRQARRAYGAAHRAGSSRGRRR